MDTHTKTVRVKPQDINSKFITIVNDGRKILETDYFESDFAKMGLVYLSFNAGTCRVLLPDSYLDVLPEMAAAAKVIISMGPMHEGKFGEHMYVEQRSQLLSDNPAIKSYEVMFEDYSEAPFAIHTTVDMSDRLLVPRDHGQKLRVAVYTKRGKELGFTGRFRFVDQLPCLKPWSQTDL